MKPTGKSLKLLIVEDSEDDTLLIIDELKRGGFNPTYKRVDTKPRFIEELSKGWEIILADYSPPRFSGDEALNALNASGRDIPLIVISGSITEEIAVSLLKSGAKDLVTKNNFSRLVPAVERELGEASVRKTQRRLSEKLREKEEQSSSFFNSANEAFILLDKELRFVQVNSNLELRAGFTNEELKGKKFVDVFPNIKKSGRLAKYLKVLKTGEPVAILNEKTLPPALGERITNLYAFKVGEGLGIVINDITDLKMYEKRLEALHEHAIKLASTKSLKEINDASLDIIVEIFNFEFISFLEVRESHLVRIGTRGIPLTEFRLPLDGKGITVKAAVSKKTILANDIREDKDYVGGLTESLSELAVPVIVDGQTVAVLNTESEKLNAFTEQDQRLFEILSSHVASAIHRIRSQELLSDSEMLTQVIMNEISDGIYIVNLDNRLIEFNQAIPRTLGYDRSELLNRDLPDIETPRRRAKFKALRAALLKNGRNLFETEVVAKNGEIIPVEVSTRLVSYKGRQAVIGVARDLRERRKNEAKLKESEKLYRTILENAPNPVSISVDGKIVYANPSRLQLTGASRFEELEGKEILSFVHPDDVPLLREKNITALKEGDARQSYEFRIRKNDGTYAQVETISTPIKFKDQQAVLHVLYDVTQRREYEKHLQNLHEYAQNLAAATTIEEAAKVVGEAVQGMLETSFDSIGIVVGDVLRFVHVYSVDWDEGGEMPINGPGITTRAVRTGETQLISDVKQDDDYYLAESQVHTSRSEVVVPIKVEGEVVAVLNVENSRVEAYTWGDVRILEMLGNHFATAIQRIRNAESLKESEESYQNLFESVNDAILIHDFDGKLLNVNPVAEQTFGYTRDELLSMNIAEIDSETDRALIKVRMEELKKKGHSIFEVTHISKARARIETDVNARIIDYDGKPAILSACRNVTERRRYIDQLHKLHQYAIRLGQASDIPTVYDVTFQEMKETIRFRLCSVLLHEEGTLSVVHQNGPGQEMKWKLPLTGKGITVRAGRTGETVYAPDVRLDPDYIETLPEVDIKSEIAVPVKVRGNVVAVLNVERSEVDAFTEAERGLLELLANHTASALIRLKQVNDLRDHERRLIALNRCASDLAATDTTSRVWDITLNLIERELKHDFAGIGVVSENSLKYVRYLGVSPSEEFRLPLNGPGITVRAIHTGETQLIYDNTKDKDFVALNMGDAGPIRTLSELAVPVKLGEKPYAVINIESTQLYAFDENDRSLLEILAKHVEEAVNRIKYVEELKFEEAQMATLHRFTNRLAEAKTFNEAGAIAADSLKAMLNTTNGSLSFVEEGNLRHRYVYGVELAEEYVQPLVGPGITVRAAVTGEPQLVSDVRDDVSYQLPEGVDIESRSELAVPVKLEGQVVAVINAERPVVDAFTLRDQRLLEILAMHLSSAFTRIRDNESKERYRSRLEALNKLVAQLDAAQSTTETATIAKNMIQSLSPSDHARLALVEGEELVGVMIPGIHQGITRLPLSGKGITVRALKERRTIHVEDTEKDPDFIKGGIEALSELAVPLVVGNQVIGVLNIESTLRSAFNPDDIKLAETLGLHISSTLERLRLDSERMETQLKLQRKEYEAAQARELERMKTRFISTATHEIRTPLTSIKGYTELIQGELKTGKLDTAKRYFDVVGRNVDRLVHLTDDLLDTQRIEEGRMTLNATTFKAMGLLMDLVAEMTPLLLQRNQLLSVSNKIEGDVHGDRNRLMQVLVNLVSNASKFSPEGSVLHLTVEKRGGDALFSLRDPGIGLTAEDISKLFRPFPGIRVEGNPEGTGLGLSICKGIVEMHGGRIWAESEGPGKGSTFSFTIPEGKK